MGDWILVLSMGLLLAYGFHLMKRLDVFFNSKQHFSEDSPSDDPPASSGEE